MQDYKTYSAIYKALADPNRLMITEMLSGGELCACKILERFKITQPTLSHHMQVLCTCGLVRARKEGKWTFYSLNVQTAQSLQNFTNKIMSVNYGGEKETNDETDCC